MQYKYFESKFAQDDLNSKVQLMTSPARLKSYFAAYQRMIRMAKTDIEALHTEDAELSLYSFSFPKYYEQRMYFHARNDEMIIVGIGAQSTKRNNANVLRVMRRRILDIHNDPDLLRPI